MPRFQETPQDTPRRTRKNKSAVSYPKTAAIYALNWLPSGRITYTESHFLFPISLIFETDFFHFLSPRKLSLFGKMRAGIRHYIISARHGVKIGLSAL